MPIEGKIISWNCRGAKSREFHINAKEIIRSYRPIILIIFETRINGEEVDQVCTKLGKSDWTRSEASGFNGGVWVL